MISDKLGRVIFVTPPFYSSYSRTSRIEKEERKRYSVIMGIRDVVGRGNTRHRHTIKVALPMAEIDRMYALTGETMTDAEAVRN